jgi:uncharacterized phage-associated protein
MHDSVTVANKFLELAKARTDTFTAVQLLKLVYIAHGWMLGFHRRPLIRDEVQAWQYGPVIPRLYSVTRKFRTHPVVGPLAAHADTPLDAAESDIVAQVFEHYGRMTGTALSRLTHAADSPWAATYHEGQFGLVISNELITDHYARLVRERTDLSADRI